jgi:hypothetical protein
MTMRSRLTRSRGPLARPLLGAIALAAVLVLLAYPLAEASDVLSNVAPASQLPNGSLANAYPYGNYTLDRHFDPVSASLTGGVDASGVAPTIAGFLAQLVWSFTALMASAVITLFTFAFSLDLVNGSAGEGGALAPVAGAVRSIYRDTFGEPWLIVAILITGLWAMWHALVRRRYTETAGALGISVLFVVIALAFVTRPEIIGQASRLTNQMSGAFLALSSNGSLANPEQAKQANADQLHARLIYEPWVVLNFGGLEHCVTGSGDQQRSVPVRPLSRDPGRDAALARRLAAGTQVQADGKVCINNRNKYAARFLRYAPESWMRELEHDALKAGETRKLEAFGIQRPDDRYRLSEADKPAAEAMGKSGQDQRLLLAVVIFLGELGTFLLLGGASVVVVVAQVLVLLLLAFAPVALVAGVVPGRGHEFFKGWLARLGTCLLRKAIYSLLLAVLLTVNAALAEATSNLGWLLAFGLQAAFNWTVFLNRRQLVGQLSHTLTGQGRVESDGLARAAVVTYATARLALRPLRQHNGRHQHGESRDQHRHGGSGDGPHVPGAPPPDGPERGGTAASRPLPGGGPAGAAGSGPVPSPTDDAQPERLSARQTPSVSDPAERATTPGGDPSRAEAEDRAAVPRSDIEAHSSDEGPQRPAGPSANERGRQREPDRESALRRGLRDDAVRVRRESRHLREEGQQLAEEGRRLRHGARPAQRSLRNGAASRSQEPASQPPRPDEREETQR